MTLAAGKLDTKQQSVLIKNGVSFFGNIKQASLILWLSSGVPIVEGIYLVLCSHGDAYVIGVGTRMGQM